MTDSQTGTPRWVKVSLVITAIVVVVFLVLLMFGKHGPGMHSLGATGAALSWR